MPIPEGGSRLVVGRGCHPTPVLGQGYPRLHLLISSGSTVGCEAGRAAHIASLAAPGPGGGHVGRCLLAGRVACVRMSGFVCVSLPVCGTRVPGLPPPRTWPPCGASASLSVK